MATVQPIVVNGGGSSAGKIIGAVVLVGGGIYAFKQLKDYADKVKAGQDLKNDQASTVKPPKGHKVFYDLNGKPITSANLATIAADLENALSYPVDGARAVRVFKSTPFGSVKDLESIYLNKYSENLKDRMISRLSDADWIKVKFDFR
jgi:hypothetical protein